MSLKPFDPSIDNETVYDEKINPLMKQIIAVCNEHNIPFVASFQYAADGQCISVLLPEGCDPRLGDARRVMQYGPVFAFAVTERRQKP